MNREQLDERYSGILLRHSRALADADGKPNLLLLAELAQVAEEHADGNKPEPRVRARAARRAAEL